MPAKYSDVGFEMVIERRWKMHKVSGVVSFSCISEYYSYFSSENSVNLRTVAIIRGIFGKLSFCSSRFEVFINSFEDRRRIVSDNTVLAEGHVEAVDEFELLFRGAMIGSSLNVKSRFVWSIHWRLIEILSKIMRMGFVVLLQLKAERVKWSSSKSFSQFLISWGSKVQRELCDKDYPSIIGALL